MSEWPIVSLKDSGVVLMDCDHKTPREHEAGLPYIGIPQLKEGRIIFDGARLISEEDFHQWRKKAKPMGNDVILSRRCNPGVTAYVPEGLEIALGQNLVLLRSDGEKLYPPFLRWVVQGSNWWDQVGKYLNVGAVFDSLKCADIPDFEIRLPPMNLQIQIAEILSAFDNKIQINYQVNQSLENIAQAIFKSWFVGFEPVKAKIQAKKIGQDPERAAMCAISGLSDEQLDQLDGDKLKQLSKTAAFFPGEFEESEFGVIPKGWGWRPLYDTASYVNGAAFKSKDFSQIGQGLPVVKITELKQGVSSGTKFTEKTYPEKYLIDNDDVLYSWSGSPQTSLEVFKWFGGKGWLNQHIFKLNFDSVAQKYFTYFLLQIMKKELIRTAQQKQTTGLGHITVADMKRIQVAYPSGDILQLFSKVAGPLFEQASNMQKQVITQSEMRDSLLPKLLSGKIAPRNAQSTAEAVA